MQITHKSSSMVIENTYHITHKRGKHTSKITYIEFLNNKNKLTDIVLRDEDGNDIDDPTLLEKIQDLVDKE